MPIRVYRSGKRSLLHSLCLALDSNHKLCEVKVPVDQGRCRTLSFYQETRANRGSRAGFCWKDLALTLLSLWLDCGNIVFGYNLI